MAEANVCYSLLSTTVKGALNVLDIVNEIDVKPGPPVGTCLSYRRASIARYIMTATELTIELPLC